MAESYPLDFPTVVKPSGVRFTAQSVVGISTSPFSFKQQVFRHPGERFQAEIQFPPMTRAQAEEFNAFRLRLRGKFGTFLLGDPAGATPRGTAAATPGTPVVNGGSQTGDSLDIDGLPLNETGYLKAGDYIQLGTGATSQLHKVLEDVDSNGDGEATLNIYPGLRSSPADDATVVVSNAKGVFRLTSNEMAWDVGLAQFYGVTLAAVEAL
jgi:hypothetical protein